MLPSPDVCPHTAKRLLCSIKASAVLLKDVRFTFIQARALSLGTAMPGVCGQRSQASYHVPTTVLGMQSE